MLVVFSYTTGFQVIWFNVGKSSIHGAHGTWELAGVELLDHLASKSGMVWIKHLKPWERRQLQVSHFFRIMMFFFLFFFDFEPAHTLIRETASGKDRTMKTKRFVTGLWRTPKSPLFTGKSMAMWNRNNDDTPPASGLSGARQEKAADHWPWDSLEIHSYLDPSVKLSHYQIPALEMYEAESGYVMAQFSWLVTNATFFVYGRWHVVCHVDALFDQILTRKTSICLLVS